MWNASLVARCVISASAHLVVPSEDPADHAVRCRPLAWWYLCDIFYCLVGLVPYIICPFQSLLAGFFPPWGWGGLKTTSRGLSYSCAPDSHWEWPWTSWEPGLPSVSTALFPLALLLWAPLILLYFFPRMLLLGSRIYSFMPYAII